MARDRSLTTQPLLRIAGWEVQVPMLRMQRGERTVKLEPRAMRVLVYLAEHAGEPVTREMLARSVWQGAVVGDEALTNAVNKLRRAFEDDARDPRVIETIPKVGYRLLAPVEVPAPEGSPAGGPARRLAAVVYADVAGYSRLTGEDEAGTHRILTEYLDHVSACVAEHAGQVMHYAGDAVLVCFDTVTDALECAVATQRELERRNAALPEPRRVRFRMGVNLGEVLMDRGEIYGNAVNVAARLEALAEPGGICVSGTVHDAAGKRLPLAFEFIGEQEVKNIAEPVRAYRVRLDAGQGSSAAPAPGASRWRRASLLALLAFPVLAGLALMRFAEEAPAPADARPSLAVLPFENLSADPEQEYFADGMTDDLITDLSKLSGLTVIARNSSFVYKGTAVDLREVGRELGVRYVLEGSVRRAGGRVRVNAQLIDAATGGHLWAERYDDDAEDVFRLQDRITRSIVTVLAVELTGAEQQGLHGGESMDPQAHDDFLKGWAHYVRQTPEDLALAVPHFERAVARDPAYGRAYAALAITYLQAYKRLWHEPLGLTVFHRARLRAEEYLAQALAHPTPLAHVVAAELALQRGAHDESVAEAERAVALDPNDPDGFVMLARALTLAGRPGEALEWIDRAIRRNPHYPAHYVTERGAALLGLERYEEAARALERAVALNREDREALRLLAAVNGLLRRADAAARTLAQIEAVSRTRGFQNFLDPLTVRSAAFWHPYRRAEDAGRFASGLRAAGVPD